MKNILLQSNRRIIEEFARSKVLLAFDFDGTLAATVAFPKRAHLRQATSRLLADLTSLYPCVVISGRAHANVLERLGGIPVHGVIGNHGIEPWGASEGMMEEVERWRPLLEKQLSAVRGVSIEDKVFSIAIHYRQSRERKKARAAIVEAAAALNDARIIGGTLVVNILPKGAPNKGMALESERERLGCDTAIYVGDDESDEDAFALNQPARLLTIRVGASPESAASHYLRGQADVDELLRVLILARQGGRGQGRNSKRLLQPIRFKSGSASSPR
jgi:trehalose 6-phosphate phosphatase